MYASPRSFTLNLGRRTVRYALISDIHANLPALDAVLAAIDRIPGVGAIHHLGDLVGYSAHPNEVVARLQDRGITGIAGNYDTTVAHDHHHCGCRAEGARQEELAHESFEYTRRAVADATKRALAALPFSTELRPMGGHRAGPRLVLVHGTPTLNTVYWTEDRDDDFARKMFAPLRLSAGDLIAFGHTHKPWHRVVDGVHLVNTGSVGRPKDGDWRAGFVIVDMDGKTVNVAFHRVAYDIDATTAAVRAAGLSPDFEAFLRSGGGH